MMNSFSFFLNVTDGYKWKPRMRWSGRERRNSPYSRRSSSADLNYTQNPWSERIWGNTKQIRWCDQRWLWMQSCMWKGLLSRLKLLSWIKPWDGGRRKAVGVLRTRHTIAYIWIFRHQKVFGAAEGQTMSQEWHLRKMSNRMKPPSIAVEADGKLSVE